MVTRTRLNLTLNCLVECKVTTWRPCEKFLSVSVLWRQSANGVRHVKLDTKIRLCNYVNIIYQFRATSDKFNGGKNMYLRNISYARERREILAGFGWKNLGKKRHRSEDLRHRWDNTKMGVKEMWKCAERSHLTQDKDQFPAVVNVAMNPQISNIAKNFSIIWGNFTVSRRTLLLVLNIYGSVHHA